MTRRSVGSGLHISTLKACSIFANYDDDELAEVLKLSTLRAVSKGAVLCCQDEACDALYVVTRGIVKLIRGEEPGRQKVMQVLYPGAGFGESAVFSNHGYPATAVALSKVEVLAIAAKGLRNFLSTRPHRMTDMAGELSHRLEHWMGQVEQLSHLNAAQKVASYLLERRRLLREQKVLYGKRVVPEPRTEIASLLAIRPETLSRTIRDFRQRNLIGIENGDIVVTNCNRLAAIANAGT